MSQLARISKATRFTYGTGWFYFVAASTTVGLSIDMYDWTSTKEKQISPDKSATAACLGNGLFLGAIWPIAIVAMPLAASIHIAKRYNNL